MTTLFKDQELQTFYKNCYTQSKDQNLPIGWLDVVFGDGNKTVESMRNYEETQEDFSYQNFYRHMFRKSKRYVDILKKGLSFDTNKTCFIFQTYLTQMYLNAEKKYQGDITQYYQYLSSLRENEVTGDEWWFDYHLREKHKHVNIGEMRRVVLELNNGVFAEDIFNFTFSNISEKALVFLVKKYKEKQRVEFCGENEKEKIRIYKNDTSEVSNENLHLFSFMRRIGVINHCILTRYEYKLGMHKNLVENYLQKYGQV